MSFEICKNLMGCKPDLMPPCYGAANLKLSIFSTLEAKPSRCVVPMIWFGLIEYRIHSAGCPALVHSASRTNSGLG